MSSSGRVGDVSSWGLVVALFAACFAKSALIVTTTARPQGTGTLELVTAGAATPVASSIGQVAMVAVIGFAAVRIATLVTSAQLPKSVGQIAPILIIWLIGVGATFGTGRFPDYFTLMLPVVMLAVATLSWSRVVRPSMRVAGLTLGGTSWGLYLSVPDKAVVRDFHSKRNCIYALLRDPSAPKYPGPSLGYCKSFLDISLPSVNRIGAVGGIGNRLGDGFAHIDLCDGPRLASARHRAADAPELACSRRPPHGHHWLADFGKYCARTLCNSQFLDVQGANMGTEPARLVGPTPRWKWKRLFCLQSVTSHCLSRRDGVPRNIQHTVLHILVTGGALGLLAYSVMIYAWSRTAQFVGVERHASLLIVSCTIVVVGMGEVPFLLHQIQPQSWISLLLVPASLVRASGMKASRANEVHDSHALSQL